MMKIVEDFVKLFENTQQKNFIKLFDETKLNIGQLQDMVSEVDLWERQGGTKGGEKHVQFIRVNSKNLSRLNDVRREYFILKEIVEKNT
jgi:hypothetical protein